MIDIAHIIQGNGQVLSLLIIGLIVILISGIPFGFFLPGDTMVFSAGFFAAQHYLSLALLILVVAVAKIIGSSIGYSIGKFLAPRLENKDKKRMFLSKENLDKSVRLYEKRGALIILLGQFVPVIRTFSPVVAGIVKMNRSKFESFNVLGGIIWATVISVTGFYLGKRITNIDKYVLPIVIIIAIFTFGPPIWHLYGKKLFKKARSKKQNSSEHTS